MKFNPFIHILLIILISPELSADQTKLEHSKNHKITIVNQGHKTYIKSDNNLKSILLSDTESTTETISIKNNGPIYSIIRESFTSGRNKTVVRTDENLKILEYISLSSEIDFNSSKKYWLGFYCSSNGVYLDDSNSGFFEEAYRSLCQENTELPKNENKHTSKDNIFTIPTTGKKQDKPIKLIALDSEKYDNVGIQDFGCIENCTRDSDELNFTGRIKNYKIKMNLSKKGELLSGSYYYDKFGTRIAISGSLKGGNIILHAKDSNRKTTESFNGHINDGHFHGTWSQGENKLPFDLYIQLI